MNNILVSKKRIEELLLIIYAFIRVINRSNLSSISDNIQKVADMISITIVLMMIILILRNNYKKKQIIFFVFLFQVILINFFISKSNIILLSYIYILAFRNMYLDTVVKSLYKGTLFGFISVIILSYFDIIEASSFFRSEGIRNTLGFIHPNTTGQILFILILLYLYINYNTLSIKKILTVLFFLFFIQYQVDSRTSFYLSIFSILLFTLCRKITNNNIMNKLLLVSSRFTLFFGFVGSVILSNLYYDYSWGIKLNSILSGRLRYQKIFIDDYSVRLFGQQIRQIGYSESKTIVGLEAMMLDNGYLKLLLVHGVILSIVFIVLYFSIINLVINRRNSTPMLICILSILMYGLSESLILSAHLNFTLLFFLPDTKEESHDINHYPTP